MSDQQITCGDCGGGFVFTEAEQDFYATKGLAGPPKRCKTCRQARRAAREGGGGDAPRGGGGGGGFGGRPQVRSFSNDRGPSRGGDRGGFSGPQAGGDRGGFGPSSGGGGGGGGGDRAFGGANSRPMRAPGGERGDRGAPRGPSRDSGGGGFRGGAERGERSFAPRGAGGAAPGGAPAFARAPRQEWGTPGGAPNRRGPGGRPDRGGDRPNRNASAGGDPSAAPQAPRAARPRPERPRFDITCATCGAQAQVPFKPLEGRQVFCQACYRARKGPSPEADVAANGGESHGEEGHVGPEHDGVNSDSSVETDAGIVE